MKKAIISVVMMVSLATYAQDKKMKMDEFTPEQKVELRTKKLCLELDLNDKQQKEIKQLLTEQSKQREETKAKHKVIKETGKEPTTEERFAMTSKMLDEKIAFRREMKKILSEKQMAKWDEMKDERMEKMHDHSESRYHKKH